jgi:cold shock CspA family protein
MDSFSCTTAAETYSSISRRSNAAGLSSLNEGQRVEYEVVSNRGKESADNLKAR